MFGTKWELGKVVRHGINTITCTESGTKRDRGRNHMSGGPGTMKGRSLASDDHVASTWGANYEVAGSKPRQTKEERNREKEKYRSHRDITPLLSPTVLRR